MSVLIGELKPLVKTFNEYGVEFALCGGLAVAVHGFVRATQDIDFLIREESLESALRAAADVGFDIRGHDISFKDRVLEIRRVSKIVDLEVVSLDLLLVTAEFEDVWETRESREFYGEVLDVVSKSGLLKMKRHAGRGQDLVDIERLENDRN